MRRIVSIEDLNDLIECHQKQLQGTISYITFLSKGIEYIEVPTLKNEFVVTERNMKYFSFLTSSFLDLLVTYKGIEQATTNWEVVYFSKIGFLTIYETIITYHEHQKEIIKLIEKNHLDFKDEYKRISMTLKKFKKDFQYDTKISNLRNKAAGHYAKEFYDYYQEIKSIDKDIAVNAIEDFLDFIKSFMSLTYALVMKEETRTRLTEEVTMQLSNRDPKSVIEFLKATN